jgi:hypothetical protein
MVSIAAMLNGFGDPSMDDYSCLPFSPPKTASLTLKDLAFQSCSYQLYLPWRPSLSISLTWAWPSLPEGIKSTSSSKIHLASTYASTSTYASASTSTSTSTFLQPSSFAQPSFSSFPQSTTESPGLDWGYHHYGGFLF